MDFYVGATDVDTGEVRYRNCLEGGSRDTLWMRASASMPMVSQIVEAEGYRLLDGGIADPVPYRILEEKGFDRCVYVLTQPKGYRKKKASGLLLSYLLLSGTPKMAEAMARRHEVYNRQMAEIDERERQGRILVIRPREGLGISRTERDPGELERVYLLGREEANRKLPRIREFLRQNAGQNASTD